METVGNCFCAEQRTPHVAYPYLHRLGLLHGFGGICIYILCTRGCQGLLSLAGTCEIWIFHTACQQRCCNSCLRRLGFESIDVFALTHPLALGDATLFTKASPLDPSYLYWVDFLFAFSGCLMPLAVDVRGESTFWFLVRKRGPHGGA